MLESLYEELIMLCEVRGELDDVSNKRTEVKIAEIEKQIKSLEK